MVVFLFGMQRISRETDRSSKEKPPVAIFDRSKAILFKEYGRNVQAMVEHLMAQEEEEKKNQLARTLIEVMRLINPQPGNDTADYYHKLWDHLHIMADFKLEIDSPFRKPTPESVAEKPLPLRPPVLNIRFKNYGKNLELLIKQAIEIEDPEEKEAAIIGIGKLIKGFYASYNKDLLDDIAVLNTITELSNGKLTIDIDYVSAEGLFNSEGNSRVTHNFQQENNRNHGRSGRNNSRQRHGGSGQKTGKRRRY